MRTFMEKHIKKAQTIAIILVIVLLGVSTFDIMFMYIYTEELNLSSCDLCYSLNPHFFRCKLYQPINFSNIIYIGYG